MEGAMLFPNKYSLLTALAIDLMERKMPCKKNSDAARVQQKLFLCGRASPFPCENYGDLTEIEVQQEKIHKRTLQLKNCICFCLLVCLFVCPHFGSLGPEHANLPFCFRLRAETLTHTKAAAQGALIPSHLQNQRAHRRSGPRPG